MKQGCLLFLLYMLAGYITIKGEIPFYSRSNTKNSYTKDHGSNVEMTEATFADVLRNRCS